MGFLVGDVFCRDVTDRCTLAGTPDSPVCVFRHHSVPLFGGLHLWLSLVVCRQLRTPVLRTWDTPSGAPWSGSAKRIARTRAVAHHSTSCQWQGDGARLRAPVVLEDAFAQFSGAEQRAFGGILCFLLCGASLPWLEICLCSDSSDVGFAVAVRETCHWSCCRADQIQENHTFCACGPLFVRSVKIRFQEMQGLKKSKMRCRFMSLGFACNWSW